MEVPEKKIINFNSDLLMEIFKFLKLKMLLNVMLVSKKFYNVIISSKIIWYKLSEEHNFKKETPLLDNMEFNNKTNYKELYNSIRQFLFSSVKTYGNYCQEYYYMLLKKRSSQIYNNYYLQNSIKINYKLFFEKFLPYLSIYTNNKELVVQFKELFDFMDEAKISVIYNFSNFNNLIIYCDIYNDKIFEYFNVKSYFTLDGDLNQSETYLIDYQLDNLPNVVKRIYLIYHIDKANYRLY